MYSKIERGDRRIKREQVPLIAKVLKDIPEELFMLWLADQDIAVVENDKIIPNKVLKIAKQNINRQ